MDILTYINKMNRLYGNDPTPVRFNTRQYLQGGRVQYKPGGLVEPGVTHYATSPGSGQKFDPTYHIEELGFSEIELDKAEELMDDMYCELDRIITKIEQMADANATARAEMKLGSLVT